MAVDATHDPRLPCWVPGAVGHAEFPIQNLPLGVHSRSGAPARIGVAIGDMVLDLSAIADLLPANLRGPTSASKLNDLFAAGSSAPAALRATLSRLLSQEEHRADVEAALHSASACEPHLPFEIGDYTDFYVGIHHATNIGKLLRPDNPLLPNYKYVPIGYHGRASTIRTTGVDVVRPRGQRKGPDESVPLFLPSQRLDYELELAAWIGTGNELGEAIPIGEAGGHLAGLSLLNDWSARDFQAWEYQPLGPFLAKNFHSTISPWVVTMEALAPFRIPQPRRPRTDPKPLPYLWCESDQNAGAFSLTLEVRLRSERMRSENLGPMRLSQGPASNMYWTLSQLVTHHSSNGCALSPGDMLGTGTISGPDRATFGSLMEISEGGRKPIDLPTGEKRKFLEDGDEVIMTARASASGFASIGFGECRALVLPAR